MSNYKQKFNDNITELMNECGAFFAFGNKQFDEQKIEGVKYVNMGSGLICPKKSASSFNEGYDRLVTQMVQDDIEENGIEEIIKRELYNHEAFYVYSIEDTIRALSDYPITAEQVQDVFHKELPNADL